MKGCKKGQQVADQLEIPVLQRPVEEILHQAGEELLSAENRQQPADQIEVEEKGHQLGDQLLAAEILQQPAEELNMAAIFGIVPWKHHVEIFTKCKPLDVATYQLQEVVERTVAELELRKRQQKG